VPAQNPLILDLRQSIPSGEELVNAVVTVTDVASGDAVTFRRGLDVFVDDTITYTADWRIDLRQIVQTFFESGTILTAFGTLGAGYFADDPELARVVSVSIDYEKKNTDGLLEDIGVTDTAANFTALNAGRQWGEVFDLAAFTAATGRRVLSNKPTTRAICRTGNDFVQYWSDNIDAAEITVYDSAGGIIALGYADVSGFLTGALVTFGTGVENINNYGAWYSAPVPIPLNAARYTITFGKVSAVFPPSLSTVVTETLTYKIMNCCEWQTTAYWLNRLGGVDAHTFKAARIIESDAESAQYEKYLSLNYSVDDYGRQKFDSREGELWTLRTGILSEPLSQWLRELQTSTRVYIEKDGALYAGVVLDAQNVIDSTDNPVVVREFIVRLSVDAIIQNNV
jgi:hypothetical protein